MSEFLDSIENLRYTKKEDQESLLYNCLTFITPGRDLTNIPEEILKEIPNVYDTVISKKVLQYIIFAIWLDEISYVWDTTRREIFMSILKDRATEFEVEYEIIFRLRVQSSDCRMWISENSK